MARTFVVALGVVTALGVVSQPAMAQKSADTLRIASADWWPTQDPYHFPLDEAAIYYRTIYETLISYDERNKKFVPRLAKAWRRIDNKTLEFDLRDDAKFSNGDPITADDWVYTVNYLQDPNVKFRHKTLYDFIAKVEALGPYKLRIVSKEPLATDLQTIAYQLYVYDAKVHRALENKADYGRTAPVTPGVYKIASLDATKMVLERNELYYDKDGPFRASIKTVTVQPMPERQTQIAHFIAGDIDLIGYVAADTARQLAQVPEAEVLAQHSGQIMYVTLDATGRSDNKAMTDQRVRKAFMMAVNREQLAKTVIPGGDMLPDIVVDSACMPGTIACAVSTKPPAYDPAGAKKLLAEAGLADGFDIELDVHQPIKEVGEAMAGQLRAVGIRASVRPLPIALYSRLRGEGKFTAFLGSRPTNGQPDVSDIYEFYFTGNRDYWKDPIIKAAQEAGLVEFDTEKRVAIYEKGMNRVNEMNYILPVAELPMVWVHRNTVTIENDRLSVFGSRLGDFAWSK
jgi:peptide/nickel transport system substrate-binding protein